MAESTVIPGDLPETVGGLDCPDHGECGTCHWIGRWRARPSACTATAAPGLAVPQAGQLCGAGQRTGLTLTDEIVNQSGARRVFLWKLHAALAIAPGDQLVCPAQSAVAADPQWSRWGTAAPFDWPFMAGQRADLIPPADGNTDFLFLYGLRAGQAGLRRPGLGCELALAFDRRVFPMCVTSPRTAAWTATIRRCSSRARPCRCPSRRGRAAWASAPCWKPASA